MKLCAVAASNLEGQEFARRVRLMDEEGLDSLWLYETPFVDETVRWPDVVLECGT